MMRRMRVGESGEGGTSCVRLLLTKLNSYKDRVVIEARYNFALQDAKRTHEVARIEVLMIRIVFFF